MQTDICVDPSTASDGLDFQGMGLTTPTVQSKLNTIDFFPIKQDLDLTLPGAGRCRHHIKWPFNGNGFQMGTDAGSDDILYGLTWRKQKTGPATGSRTGRAPGLDASAVLALSHPVNQCTDDRFTRPAVQVVHHLNPQQHAFVFIYLW